MKLKQAVIWIAALVIGGIFGSLGVGWLNEFMDFMQFREIAAKRSIKAIEEFIKNA